MEWLFLLLPVAAASGWWLAKRAGRDGASAGHAPDPAYFRGLNYVLNEQPDKAIDVFIKLAQVDRETVETHLALGSLFRRRGEVDRAIRIHQSLVARSDLGKEQRAYALLELGQDYMLAGLFDRAESLFVELVEMRLQRGQALERLLEIYQQERDWVRCLDVAHQLQSITGMSMRTEIAQYHCEIAEATMKTGDVEAATARLRDAQSADPDCVRALLLQARMAMDRGDAGQAAALYRRVAARSPQFIPEILPQLLKSHGQDGQDDLLEELWQLHRTHPSPPLMLALADAVEAVRGQEAAWELLLDSLSAHADLDVLQRLLELQRRRVSSDQVKDVALYQAILEAVRQLRARAPHYRCEQCGFVARRLHWQCPSCKYWGSIKPVQPLSIPSGADAAPERRIA
jgi:lipopolysaccharide biosynthesis regulator YciM